MPTIIHTRLNGHQNRVALVKIIALTIDPRAFCLLSIHNTYSYLFFMIMITGLVEKVIVSIVFLI